ncbi:MAG: DUF3718 domain-containing protein [Paraglaciecola sp.]|nr:DUF3718 domain-containing protein [Paraglaciecola sp.]NCT48138.1 DUF3718 domain-containing protein [Paraglaciecola sp.]
MKKAMVVTTMLSTLLFTGFTQAKSLDKYTTEKLVNVCEAIKSDSRIRLKKAVEATNTSYKNLAKGLVCNGMDTVQFALAHQANKTANYLASRSHIEHQAMLAKR